MNNAELNVRIDELWAQTKRGELPRADRFKAVESLTDGYVQNTGKRPPTQALDRLATLCLYEEITDGRLTKMSDEEHPIMSDRQEERRHNSEASFKLAEEHGTDGKCHARPTPRRRK